MSRTMAVSEHDDEAEPGLPAPLPAGERLLWRGAPDWRLLARHGFYWRWFALYFAVLIVWRGAATLLDGGSATSALATTLWTVPLAAMVLGCIAGLAWLVARNTVYTLTDKRVVMRVGIVLTVTFNLPLRRIDTVRLHNLHGLPNGAGDVALLLHNDDRIGYLHLWPHVRPWHFNRTEPMLCALPEAAKVAQLLGDALAQSAGVTMRAAETTTAATTATATTGAQPARQMPGVQARPGMARAA